MTSSAPGPVRLEGLSYPEVIDVLENSELTGMAYSDLLGYLDRDLVLGIDGMPVQSNQQPADGQVLAWKKSKGAWIPETVTPSTVGAAYSGLGQFYVSQNFTGSFGTAGLPLVINKPITIKNPAGALVRWVFGASGYSASTGNKANYMLNTDGASWLGTGNGMYFNVATQHMWLGTGEFINFMSAGTHQLSFGMYATGSSFLMDSNDFFTFAAYELP